MVNEETILMKDAEFGYHPNQQVVIRVPKISIPKGKLIALVGLNGSGKSTFLRTLCKFQPLLKGEIIIEQQSINTIPIAKLATKISITLTEKIHGFNLTCFDAVCSGMIRNASLFGEIGKVNLEKAEKLLEEFNLSSYKNKPLHELSDGIYQKTMIAKSILQETPVMLFDEPTAYLDFASKHELFKTLSALANHENKCIILSTHELDFVMRYCDAILIVANQSINCINVTEAKRDTEFNKLSAGYL
ncbi:MAG: ABC transporter ATP-binding protein [Bacteroidetes bacterium]|nr:ABC transporter ATP-binding protein [Bacteroidota bacterium]MCA6442405.1 ABC transporter ATP-binding protein [Bacteroidota bacterium]